MKTSGIKIDLKSPIKNQTRMKNQKSIFIPQIWICGLDDNGNEIIGRTIYVNDKKMINYLSENGTMGLMEFGKIRNLFKIEPDFQKERFWKKISKQENNALNNLLAELKIKITKN